MSNDDQLALIDETLYLAELNGFDPDKDDVLLEHMVAMAAHRLRLAITEEDRRVVAALACEQLAAR